MTFSDWGRLICFDTDERQVGGEGVSLATIPKLGKRWKVIFDFKPSVPPPDCYSPELSFMVDDDLLHSVSFSRSKAILTFGIWIGLETDHQLKFGEWNRIEMTHDEGEDGRFFLSLSVGERELGQMDLGNLEQEKFTNVEVWLTYRVGDVPPDFPPVRRFLVIEKC